MEYQKIDTLDEAKAYFKSLWRPMPSECVLKNLKKILNFLQSPAEEVCFVNMQEKYLPFYYMIVLDEEFLQTTFLTDECKVVANEILQTMEANKNSFTWEVTFSRQIAGIPVIFRKLYNKPSQKFPKANYEKPIRSEFKDTWIKTTLKFIKSSRLILKYPEMPHREALYLYRGILKLNDEELGSDSLWKPVWEALNIFKLRYEYIVSLYATAFDYLKFVHFEKVCLIRNKCAIENQKPNVSLDMNESKLLTSASTNDDPNNPSKNHKICNNVILPVINHKELVKTLLEMNITKSGTIIYTLKLDKSSKAPERVIGLSQKVDQLPLNNKTNKSSFFENETVCSEDTKQNTSSILPDDHENVSLSIVIQDGETETNLEHTELNEAPVTKFEIDSANENTILTDDPIKCPDDTVGSKGFPVSDIERTINTVAEETNDHQNADEHETKTPSNETEIQNENVNLTSMSSTKNEDFCKNIKTQTINSPSNAELALDDIVISVDDEDSLVTDTEMNVIAETTNLSKAGKTNKKENPFIEQIIKLQEPNRSLYLEEKDFLAADDTAECEDIDYENDIDETLRKSTDLSQSIYDSDDSTAVYRKINKTHSKTSTKPPPSLKSIVRKEAKAQRRHENKIRRKQKLVDSVSTKFILKSFSAILDFINDDARASMEFVSLTIQEFNVLVKFNSLISNVFPTEKIFNTSCVGLAKQIFNRLKEKNDISLHVDAPKPSEIKRNKSNDVARQRYLTFRKKPFKNSKISLSKPSKHNIKSASDRDLEGLRNPKSILEKMCLMPQTKSRLVVDMARSPSSSPARGKASPGNYEESIDKAVRAPGAKLSDTAAGAMKAKLLEGLSVPLESDKAMRMMRLMGWKGGALGVRAGGITEPIQPQLNVPKGVGLGHKSFKSTNLNTNQLQKKVTQQRNAVQVVETVVIDEDSSDVIKSDDNKHKINTDNKNVHVNCYFKKQCDRHTVLENNNNKHDIATDNQNDVATNVDAIENSNDLKREKSDSDNKSQTNENNNIDNGNQINNPNETVCNLNDGTDASSMNSNTETDSKAKIENPSWLPSKSRFQNFKDSISTANASEAETVESKGEVGSAEATEGSSWLTNDSLLQKIKLKSNLNTDETKPIFETNSKQNLKDLPREGISKISLVEMDVDSVRSNHGKIMKNSQNINDDAQWRVENDELLHPYTRESRTRYLSDRTQFLVHLLDLLQADKETFTAVSYLKRPSREGVGFIDSTIWSLNRRMEANPILPREKSIIDACAREMEAHSNLLLSYRFNKKALILVKNDITSNTNPLNDVLNSMEVNFVAIHTVKDYRLYKQMPEGAKGIARSKIITNRIVLEFVESDDDVRVYDYGKTSLEVRAYVTSLMSLLNRQSMQYQLGLGTTEHPIFRKTLNAMKDFCLIFRFDTQESFFNKLQLVKIYLTKRCGSCQLGSLLNSELNVNPHEVDEVDVDDIELYPNRFDSSKYDTDKSDNEVIGDKNKDSLNQNENEISDKASYTDEDNDIKSQEQYLVGENWLHSNVNDGANNRGECDIKSDEINTSESNETIQNISQEEASKIEQDVTELSIEILPSKDTFSELHNLPKRVKKNETDNNGEDQNIEWNAADKYKDSTQNILKRKISNVVQKLDEASIEDIKPNASKNLPAIYLENSLNTIKTVTKTNDANIPTADVLASDVTMTDNTKNTEGKQIVEVKPKSNKLNVNSTTDVRNWPKNILVVHYEYPKYEIDANSAMMLQSIIYENIDKKGYLPRLKCYGLKNGGIIYTCYDHKSYIWLYEQLQWYYKLLDYEQDLNTTYVIQMKINSFIKVDMNVIFNNIEQFYENIKTASWKVIQTKYHVGYCIITIEIDDSSLKNLKKEDYSLFVGVDKADITVIYDQIK